MKGTILDFLKLASEKPELTKELVELGIKYDFQFSGELSDDELEAVSGGSETTGASGSGYSADGAEEAMKEMAASEQEKDQQRMAASKEHIERLKAMISEMNKLSGISYSGTINLG